MQSVSDLAADLLTNEDWVTVNRGAVTEQFVGQELLGYRKPYTLPESYYWERGKKNSTAEVDYVTYLGRHVIPIEVKSGATGRLKSLQVFLDEKQLDIGIQISQKPLSFDSRVLSLPLYMISELPRLFQDLISV